MKDIIHRPYLLTISKTLMKITQSTFGLFNEYVLQNPSTNEAVHILPELGGIIHQLVLKTETGLHKIINCGNTPEELLSSLLSYPSTHLFPWGNRVKSGQYEFEGTSYQLPLNEVGLQNALHGFVYTSPFKVYEATESDTEAILTLEYLYKGGYVGYPFPFQLLIKHTLNAKGLTLSYTINNIGAGNLPVSLGWHPYFSIEGETKNDWTVSFPSTHQYLLDDQMCPVDRTPKHYSEGFNLNGQILDAVFAVEKQEIVEVILQSNKQDLSIKVWQQAGEQQFNYSVVYTPPSGDRIAIEPMTAPTNALNSKENLLVISAGESYTVECGVMTY